MVALKVEMKVEQKVESMVASMVDSTDSPLAVLLAVKKDERKAVMLVVVKVP